MLSKLIGWIAGGTDENEKEKTTGSSASSGPPPVPEKTVSLKDHLQSNGTLSEGYKPPVKTFTTANGDLTYPQALASAFEQPQKDKKPFTYFTGGHAPDLSSHPSPKTVRHENKLINGPTVPRVLPIVSDDDLRYEEQRFKTPSPVEMPTLSHVEYNSPLPLYSRENVQEELNRATGGRPVSTPPQFNIQQSGTYRLLHTGVPEQHSARLDDSSSEDYPRYRGFVNPNIQSPSFKRLQYVAGLHSDDEDQQPIEVSPSAVRSEERNVESVSRGVSVSEKEQPIALGFSDQGGTNLAAREDMPSPGYQGGPNWSSEGPPIAQYDTTHYDDRGRTPDPTFLAKIAEAERPRVPAPVTPAWAKKAEQKHQKWQGYGGGEQRQEYYAPPQPRQEYAPAPPRQEYYAPAPPRQEYYAPAPPRQEYYAPPPARTSPPARTYQTPVQWSTPTPEPFRDRRQNQPYIIRTYSATPDRSRARSTEPDRSRRTEREWMKPYIAPNVLDPRYTPVSGRTSTSPMFRSYHVDVSSRQNASPALGGGQHYGGLSGGDYSKRTTSSTYRRTESRSKSPYRITTTYAPPQTTSYPRIETPVSTVAVREPSWSQQRYDSSNTSSTRLWQHEGDARRRQREMEEEVSRRSVSAGPSSRSPTYGSSTQWVPTDRTVSTYTTTGPAVTQKWQDASGASTKTQTQGSYVDADGNTVNYTKEIYTTSDPGKEFSMLTQEEKKVLEEPLQPGVISRHITTKYYKKSTYTSTTTTSTNQTPPAVSYPRRLQIGPGESQY